MVNVLVLWLLSTIYPRGFQYGNENPCNRVDFDYHLSKFELYTDDVPIVYNLDELRKLKEFPKKNITFDMFKEYEDHFGYREINKEDKSIIKEALKNYNRDNLKHKVKLI